MWLAQTHVLWNVTHSTVKVGQRDTSCRCAATATPWLAFDRPVHTNFLSNSRRDNLQYGAQGWGGPDSVAKADAFIRDVIGWFYDNTGMQAFNCCRNHIAHACALFCMLVVTVPCILHRQAVDLRMQSTMRMTLRGTC